MKKLTRRRFLELTGVIGGSLGFSSAILTKFASRPSIATATATDATTILSQPPNLQSFEFVTVTVDASGLIIGQNRHSAEYFSEKFGATALEMVAIPSGTFLMGTPEGEKGDFTGSDKPQHPVTVSSFYLSQYPITQKQWKTVASLPKVNRELDPDPSHFKADDLPVESVSWHEAIEFCDRLSLATGRAYQLPSEARWEYACRGGTTSPFYFGATLTSQFANYYAIKDPYAVELESEFRSKTTPVGIFPPNAFGLYDIHGSLYEWCADSWHRNYDNAPADGTVWLAEPNSTGDRYRILRGGGWGSDARACRSANRAKFSPDNRYSVIGFRVMML